MTVSAFGADYNPSDCVRIVNPVQAGLYVDNGARLVDFYRGYNRMWVWIFNKKETCELFKLWNEHKLV